MWNTKTVAVSNDFFHSLFSHLFDVCPCRLIEMSIRMDGVSVMQSRATQCRLRDNSKRSCIAINHITRPIQRMQKAFRSKFFLLLILLWKVNIVIERNSSFKIVPRILFNELKKFSLNFSFNCHRVMRKLNAIPFLPIPANVQTSQRTRASFPFQANNAIFLSSSGMNE